MGRSTRSRNVRWLGLQFGHQLLQRGRIDRLDEMAVEPRRPGAVPVLFLAPARQGDNDDVLPPGLLPEVAAGVVAVEPGHPDVQQDDLRPKLAGGLDARNAVV